ncbi:porin family protein [Psychroserpens sp. Hel_I_66]|uniref:porin family protein n=1 Tax=Psychroserpens sp. Hel_I_66 TaxID=1250004 RepID=UPI0006482D58|nr:porin family protein [Psychroserpens sp. Hel_I_66]
MKKLMLFAAVAAFGLSSVNAQEVKFGAKAGVNFATIGGDVEDADGRTAFHVGGVAEIMISDKFSVQPELLYSAQGLQQKEEFEGFTFESKLKLDYINIPIMAKYYVAEGFSIEAGPQVGFLLSAKEEFEFEGDSEEEDVKDAFNSIDFGAGVGVGYRMDSGLNFSARYVLGLSNIFEDSGDFSAQNNVIQVSVGYFFN